MRYNLLAYRKLSPQKKREYHQKREIDPNPKEIPKILKEYLALSHNEKRAYKALKNKRIKTVDVILIIKRKTDNGDGKKEKKMGEK